MKTILSSLLAVLMLCASPVFAQKKRPLKAEDVTPFQARFRVTSIENKAPTEEQKFTFGYGVGKLSGTAVGSAWTDWLSFGVEQFEATVKAYPNDYMKWWPVTFWIGIGGIKDPTLVEMETRFTDGGPVTKHTADMFGGTLVFMQWEDGDGKPHLSIARDYNQRYWEVLKAVTIPENERPKLFAITDRFLGRSNDRKEWEEGIAMLARGGFSVLEVPANAIYRDMLLKAGLRRTSNAFYIPPPTGLFPFNGPAHHWGKDYTRIVTQEDIDAAMKEKFEPYWKAGFKPEDIAMWVSCDEPSWYYTPMFKTLMQSPGGMKQFHDYLAAQGLTPRDVGAQKWETVEPLGLGGVKDLPTRKLHYWTMRFFPWASSQHFANITKAIEKAVRPGLPIGPNWNTFSGRVVSPGAKGNNREEPNPDIGWGGHDWLEFGRMRGGTMLATEDWFADGMAPQWSYYCARMRSGAAKSGGGFGALVVPRTAGQIPQGITQKILTLIGHGAKSIQYFVFGPEYNFPVNCYSENLRVLPDMVEAHRLIGKAEEVLWPGVQARGQVAILYPRSSFIWDPKGTQDATNMYLTHKTVDYLMEVYSTHLAFQHLNIPVDFVEEDDLSPAGLAAYKVLYVTEPCIPEEFQRGLVEWVKAGGSVVTTSGAGTADRYDQPCKIMGQELGMAEEPRERLVAEWWSNVEESGKGSGSKGDFTAFGPRGKLIDPKGAHVVAAFSDGDPAVIERDVERGRVIHFTWLPGGSYYRSAATPMTGGQHPTGFSATLRNMITDSVARAGVTPPVTVSCPQIEAPLLLSSKGAAVTVLNWTGEGPQKQVHLTVKIPFTAKSVESMKTGKLPFTQTAKGVHCALPLDAVDIIVIKP